MSSRAYLVLGATGGMGQTLCERLSKRGASLLIGGRDPVRLEELSKRIGAEALAGDVREPLAVERAVACTVERFGRSDGAVNLVGSLLLKPAHLTKPDEWDDVVSTNLRSDFHPVRAAAKAMRGQGGSIVLVSSAAARTGLVNHEAIAAAKAGIEGLARSAAARYEAQGIRVNCVAPGLVRTCLYPIFIRVLVSPGRERPRRPSGSFDPGVSTVKSSDPRYAEDLRPSRGPALGSSTLGSIPDRRVDALAVAVLDVLPEESSRVVLAQDDDVVEELPPDGAHEALGDPVLPGAVERRLLGVNPDARIDRTTSCEKIVSSSKISQADVNAQHRELSLDLPSSPAILRGHSGDQGAREGYPECPIQRGDPRPRMSVHAGSELLAAGQLHDGLVLTASEEGEGAAQHAADE